MSLHGDLHEPPWSSMETSAELHGDLHRGSWSSMEAHGAHGAPWRLHGVPDNIGRPPELHGDLHGAPWRSVEVRRRGSWRAPWRTSILRGWSSMETSTDLHGDLHEPPWSSMETSTELYGDLHGGSWSSMELRGDLHGVPDNVGRRPQASEVAQRRHKVQPHNTRCHRVSHPHAFTCLRRD